MGKSRVRNICAPLQDRLNHFMSSFCGVETFHAPLPSVWLKPQAPVLKLPQNFLCPLPLPGGLKLFQLPLVDDHSLKKKKYLTVPLPPPPPPLTTPSHTDMALQLTGPGCKVFNDDVTSEDMGLPEYVQK